MKNIKRNNMVLIVFVAIVTCFEAACGSAAPPAEQAKTVSPAAAAAAACAMPTAMASSNEQTAWQLFVAANCSTNGHLTWETWTEQTCFENPASPGCGAAGPNAAVAEQRHLHASRLRELLHHKAGKALAAAATPGGCNSMTTTGSGVPELVPFVPKNLGTKPEFCEEVYVDPSESAFVKTPSGGATLTTLTAQVAYAKTTTIAFPTPGVEVKADWLPADSLSTPFTCTAPPTGVYTETITGKCYALVGMHITSKLLPNWLWATFEPQNTDTNPNRCNPNLYNACSDPWGSNPASSTGQPTQQTAALTTLMTQAGLPPQFANYRLVAAQSAYLDANNNPIQVGNSFVEFNAEVLPHQASCITCHSYAMVSTVAQENPNFGNFPGTPPIGTPGAAPLPAQGGGTWVSQDFSWMLGIMPTNPKKK